MEMCSLVLVELQNVSLPGNVLELTTTADGDWLESCSTSRTCAVYDTSDMNTVGAMFQNELILPVGFSAIALFVAKLSGCGGWEQQQFELLLQGSAGSVAVDNYINLLKVDMLFVRCMEGSSTPIPLMHIS